jgi:hypothetical protein
MGLYWPRFLSVKGYVCRKFSNNVGSHTAELILFGLQNYIECSHIQTFWIVSPADVVFTTSVRFDISIAKFAEFFLFLPSVHIAKKAQPHKCAYAREGLRCQIHKLFKQQRRSTNSAVTFVL